MLLALRARVYVLYSLHESIISVVGPPSRGFFSPGDYGVPAASIQQPSSVTTRIGISYMLSACWNCSEVVTSGGLPCAFLQYRRDRPQPTAVGLAFTLAGAVGMRICVLHILNER